MSEQEIKNKEEYVTDACNAHLKYVLDLANAINTAVASGKMVLVESYGGAHVMQIAGAIPLTNEIVCIKHYPFPPDGADEIPAFWPCGGAAITARYPESESVDFICKKYISQQDRWSMKRLSE